MAGLDGLAGLNFRPDTGFWAGLYFWPTSTIDVERRLVDFQLSAMRRMQTHKFSLSRGGICISCTTGLFPLALQ